MVRVSCVYVKSLLYALFIMLVLYAAWSSLLCNFDFSCFKSLYYVPFTLVVLVCCSLPLLSSLTISSLFFFSNCNFNYERERAFEIHVKRSRTVKSCFVFLRTHTHPINTANRGEFVIIYIMFSPVKVIIDGYTTTIKIVNKSNVRTSYLSRIL